MYENKCLQMSFYYSCILICLQFCLLNLIFRSNNINMGFVRGNIIWVFGGATILFNGTQEIANNNNNINSFECS
jgi:hypothetical protein